MNFKAFAEPRQNIDGQKPSIQRVEVRLHKPLNSSPLAH